MWCIQLRISPVRSATKHMNVEPDQNLEKNPEAVERRTTFKCAAVRKRRCKHKRLEWLKRKSQYTV
jgi:hypothetical protein